MFKAIKILQLLLLFVQGMAICQVQKAINLYECKYVYTGYEYADTKPGEWYSTSPRIIYARKDTIQRQLAAIIKDALNRNMGTQLENINLNVERIKINYFSAKEFPIYKPKLPKKYSQKHELCFRIIDRKIPLNSEKYDPSLGYVGSYIFEYKILNGVDGTEVVGRTMEVLMRIGDKPEDCSILKKIPGIPIDFLKCFKEAVNIFFSPKAPASLSVFVKPACLFVDEGTGVNLNISHPIRFEQSETTIKMLNGPDLGWSLMPMEKEQIGKTKKEGAGIVSGLFALAGVSNSKDRSEMTPYMTGIKMEDQTTGILYGFYQPIIETLSEEVYTDRKQNNGTVSVVKDVGPTALSRSPIGMPFVLRGTDTIGHFYLSKNQSAKGDTTFIYAWNGTDSATITQVPKYWNTSGPGIMHNVEGEIYGKPVLFLNSIVGGKWDVWYDNQLVASLMVENNLPGKGVLYDTDVPEEILKVLGMMACIPYSFFMGG